MFPLVALLGCFSPSFEQRLARLCSGRHDHTAQALGEHCETMRIGPLPGQTTPYLFAPAATIGQAPTHDFKVNRSTGSNETQIITHIIIPSTGSIDPRGGMQAPN